MNCQDFEATILSMARMQLLETSARRQTLAHIAACPACADLLAEQQTLTVAIRSTVKGLREESASLRVEHSLRAALRSQTKVASHRHVSLPKWQWPRQTLLAAAAILLLFLMAGVIRQWLLADKLPKTAVTLPTPPKPGKPEPQPEHPLSATNSAPVVERQFAGKPRKKRPVIRPETTTVEDDTEFIVLANESQLVPLESGQVLRVELPTAALISMGLRITTEDLSKPVLADLLVGQDGLPRAIRFVRASATVASDSQEHSTNQ